MRRRLDFSYFEFDLPTFDRVVAGCWDFHVEFKARTGFGPAGYAIYFVQRGYPAGPSAGAQSARGKAQGTAGEAGKAADGATEAGGTTTSGSTTGSGGGRGLVEPTVAARDGSIRITATSGSATAAGEQRRQQQADAALPKPHGNYSKWGRGVSFMLDPLTGDADNPMVRARMIARRHACVEPRVLLPRGDTPGCLLGLNAALPAATTPTHAV
jgi:hypothetical protein